jgi:hypothetical protein
MHARHIRLCLLTTLHLIAVPAWAQSREGVGIQRTAPAVERVVAMSARLVPPSSRTSGAAHGALVGAGIGAAVGILVVALTPHSDHSEDAMGFVVGAAGGALVGLIVGAVIGVAPRAPVA